MSSDSLAAFRKGLSKDLNDLADQHMQHDLNQSDRDALQSAAQKLPRHAMIGSFLGLGLGVLAAYRLRANRVKFFDAFKAMQRPTHVKFADGREEAIPDITPYLKPTSLGDVATYTFFSIAGLFIGGELGILTGASAAKRSISKDPESRQRIERAFRGFRADMFRKQAQLLDEGKGTLGLGM